MSEGARARALRVVDANSSPDAVRFASGGEDGYVRVHHLDDSYFVALGEDQIEELLA